MNIKPAGKGHFYQIRVKEILSLNTLDWDNSLEVDMGYDQGTVLSGWFPDQPALRGLLEYLWNLNLTILSIEIKENETPSTSDQQGRKV
jgi:hypothetical protein